MFVLPISNSSLRPHRSAIQRPDGAPSLAHVIDRLFDGAHFPAPVSAARTPALDVDETNAHYLLKFDLPGASKEALKVSIEGRRVRIETSSIDGAVEPSSTDAKATDNVAQDAPATPSTSAGADIDVPRSLYRERSNLVYARTVSLPQEVDSDASEAKLDNGVLTLRLAKRRVDGARRLVVN